MSYQVLARKWRPRTFREMVGQEHVLKALINALDHNRLHHAYLFTGTRGVGKTTIARILAKCLNCEAGVTSTPCGECSSCNEIAEGRFVDLIEVDAASRTKVEDTRELLDNVQYAPTRGRYKIYLIDEVHMLSNHSFNALLKTLEEPPEHVKFLLATTDPQKLPVTILSRCLQFNLKNMSPERIVEHLSHVLTSEAVPFEESALWLLARSADGSMRDALSLTDQAVAFGGGKVSDTEVAAMLGTIDHVLIEEIMSALVAADGPAILAAVAKFAEHAPDFDAALADMLTLLHRIAIAQALPEALDNSYGDREQILHFATALAPEDVQMYYQTALIGRRDLPLASDPRMGLEMTLLRMLAFKPQGVVDVPKNALPGAPQPAAATETAAEEENAPVKKPIATPEAPTAPTASEHTALAETVSKPSAALESSPPARGEEFISAQNPQPVSEPAPKASSSHVDEPRSHEVSRSKRVMAALNSEHDAFTNAAATRPSPQQVVTDEPSESVAKATASAQQEAQALSDQPIPLADFDAEHWINVYHQMNVRGIVQSTAANCVMVGRNENHVQFILDQEKTSLYDPSHGQRLGDLLSDYFSHPVRVDIQLADIPNGMETPAQHDERRRRENHAKALQTLQNDPVVQTLQREFGAVLQEDTVNYSSE